MSSIIIKMRVKALWANIRGQVDSLRGSDQCGAGYPLWVVVRPGAHHELFFGILPASASSSLDLNCWVDLFFDYQSKSLLCLFGLHQQLASVAYGYELWLFSFS